MPICREEVLAREQEDFMERVTHFMQANVALR